MILPSLESENGVWYFRGTEEVLLASRVPDNALLGPAGCRDPWVHAQEGPLQQQPRQPSISMYQRKMGSCASKTLQPLDVTEQLNPTIAHCQKQITQVPVSGGRITQSGTLPSVYIWGHSHKMPVLATQAGVTLTWQDEGSWTLCGQNPGCHCFHIPPVSALQH